MEVGGEGYLETGILKAKGFKGFKGNNVVIVKNG